MAEQIAIILTQEDSDGRLVPFKNPATVELGVYGGVIVKDLISGIVNNGDGTYSIDPSGLTFNQIFYLKVDGVIGAEWSEFRLPSLIQVPSGGLTDQVLAKVNNSDYNFYWRTVGCPLPLFAGSVVGGSIPKIQPNPPTTIITITAS